MASELSISRKETPWFYDEHSALELVRSIRWANGVECPRCGSRDVRDVATNRSLEVLSCRDCRYNFNSAADTYFHGSRIPFVSQFQFLSAAALEPAASASRLSRIMGWKTTTVSRQLARLGELRAGGFVKPTASYRPFEDFTSAPEYLEQPGVVIDFGLFRERLANLLANRGKPLRREGLKPSKSAPQRQLTAPVTRSFTQKGIAATLPSNCSYLVDEEAAYSLVNSLRWFNQTVTCPRCTSSYVQTIKTKNPRNLYRCQDCHYMFNSLSGTVFHASKIPIRKHLQFFILQNALADELGLQDTTFAISCTRITAARLMKQAENLACDETFAKIDKKLADRLRIEAPMAPQQEAFFLYCDAKGILLYEPLFIEHLRTVCRAIVK